MMTERVFCPSCQTVQPVVGEGEEQRCGYCKRVLGVSVPREPMPEDREIHDRLMRLEEAVKRLGELGNVLNAQVQAMKPKGTPKAKPVVKKKVKRR